MKDDAIDQTVADTVRYVCSRDSKLGAICWIYSVNSNDMVTAVFSPRTGHEANSYSYPMSLDKLEERLAWRDLPVYSTGWL